MAVKHPTFIPYLLMPGTKPVWYFRDRSVYERLFPRDTILIIVEMNRINKSEAVKTKVYQ